MAMAVSIFSISSFSAPVSGRMKPDISEDFSEMNISSCSTNAWRKGSVFHVEGSHPMRVSKMLPSEVLTSSGDMRKKIIMIANCMLGWKR